MYNIEAWQSEWINKLPTFITEEFFELYNTYFWLFCILHVINLNGMKKLLEYVILEGLSLSRMSLKIVNLTFYCLSIRGIFIHLSCIIEKPSIIYTQSSRVDSLWCILHLGLQVVQIPEATKWLFRSSCTSLETVWKNLTNSCRNSGLGGRLEQVTHRAISNILYSAQTFLFLNYL